MPLFSAFTPYGALTFSGEPSVVERIYRSMVAEVGPNYARGGLHDARLYARARMLARALLSAERAGNQLDPDKVTDLLPELEKDYGIRPGTLATILERRAELKARMLLPAGVNEANLVAVLQALLGSNFVRIYIPSTTEAIRWPDDADGDQMNFRLPTVDRKTFKLLGPVTDLGSTFYVSYTHLDGSEVAEEDRLVVGERVMVEPEHNVLGERVSVSHVGFVDSVPAFAGVFFQPHNPGAIVATQPYPAWWSSKRVILVIVKPAAARDPETRRKIDELMRRIVRGVTLWSIAEETTPGKSGPFQIGISPLGSTTVTELPP
jgi:hypothetical protein